MTHRLCVLCGESLDRVIMSDDMNDLRWNGGHAKRRVRIGEPCMLLLIATALGMAGCGNRGYSTSRLEGRITVDGQPIERGSISFAPLRSDRGPGVSAAVEAGHYVAANVPQGKVRVGFHAVKETGRSIMQFGKPYPEAVNVIPDKYRVGMEIEIAGDDAHKDFSL